MHISLSNHTEKENSKAKFPSPQRKKKRKKMALEAVHQASSNIESNNISSPRISFSAEFLDENNFISINPHSQIAENKDLQLKADNHKAARSVAEFEFLNSTNVSSHAMLSADELFFEGKLLPFWQMHHCSEKLKKISLKTKEEDEEEEEIEAEVIINKETESSRVSSWFVDDDPSPRPPKCTVLWKELLRLKKQRASSLSPSSSSSSTSSSSSSMADIAEETAGKEGSKNRDNNKHVKRIKKGLERTRSASIRIRPMINVPICSTQSVKSSALPPLFPLRKGRLER